MSQETDRQDMQVGLNTESLLLRDLILKFLISVFVPY